MMPEAAQQRLKASRQGHEVMFSILLCDTQNSEEALQRQNLPREYLNSFHTYAYFEIPDGLSHSYNR